MGEGAFPYLTSPLEGRRSPLKGHPCPSRKPGRLWRALRRRAFAGHTVTVSPACPVGSGIIGKTVATGEIWLPGKGMDLQPAPRESNLSVCVPLTLDGKVIGALALFRLLPQKAGFEAIDYELFNLLATHAATALYLSRLHAESQAIKERT